MGNICLEACVWHVQVPKAASSLYNPGNTESLPAHNHVYSSPKAKSVQDRCHPDTAQMDMMVGIIEQGRAACEVVASNLTLARSFLGLHGGFFTHRSENNNICDPG